MNTLSAISCDENNVNKHTTFCDVRKRLKDRSKSTKCKVMFLTSNKIEYCCCFHKWRKVLDNNYLSWYLCEFNRSIFLLDFVSLNPY